MRIITFITTLFLTGMTSVAVLNAATTPGSKLILPVKL
jgi:hypothetical protein